MEEIILEIGDENRKSLEIENNPNLLYNYHIHFMNTFSNLFIYNSGYSKKIEIISKQINKEISSFNDEEKNEYILKITLSNISIIYLNEIIKHKHKLTKEERKIIKNYWRVYELNRHLKLNEFKKSIKNYSLLSGISIYKSCEELCKKIDFNN